MRARICIGERFASRSIGEGRSAGFAVRWLVVLLALAGCDDRERSQLEAVRRDVCACKDVACAETAMKKVPQGDVHATRREQDIARAMLDCLAKLYDDAKPVAPAE